MSISDSSQWSDLSGISRISRSSSTRPLTRFDSVVNMSECPASSSFRELLTTSTVTGSVDGGSSDLAKAVKAIVACEDSIVERARMKFLYDCVNKTATTADSETLQSSTVKKLEGILAMHAASKYLQLPDVDNCHEELTLLGITDLPKIHLTHDEKRDVGVVAESLLRENLNNFIIRYETLGGTMKEVLKNNESPGRAYLIENPGADSLRWKDQIDKVCAEYHTDLLRCADLLLEWQRLKYIDMKEINLRNAENLLLKAHVAEAQVKIVDRMSALRMFKETSTTVEAFKILSENVDDRLLEAREKLRSRRALRVAYADVSGGGYDQLLTKYTELSNKIKKQEHLMEML